MAQNRKISVAGNDSFCLV